METSHFADAWREMVNNNHIERPLYNELSVNDYFDMARSYFTECIADIDPSDEQAVAQVLLDVTQLMSDLQHEYGEIGELYVRGNGFYLPENSDDILFTDGTPGLRGEFDSFSVMTLPTYAELLNGKPGDLYTKLTLCMELRNYSTVTSSGVALEVNKHSPNAAIPIEAQDFTFMRATPSA